MALHDKAVARRRSRRKFAHVDLPPFREVEAKHGERFVQLVDMLLKADPAELHTRKSRKGQDPRHVEGMISRYRMLAWSLIHRLEPEDAIANVERILLRELELWFDPPRSMPEPEDPEGLVQQLSRWRSRWDYA